MAEAQRPAGVSAKTYRWQRQQDSGIENTRPHKARRTSPRLRYITYLGYGNFNSTRGVGKYDFCTALVAIVFAVCYGSQFMMLYCAFGISHSDAGPPATPANQLHFILFGYLGGRINDANFLVS
jgi:hypothetical protein